MLNIQGVNFKDLFTYTDIQEYALVADPNDFEFLLPDESDLRSHDGKPHTKIKPFTAQEVQDIFAEDNYSCVILQGFQLNNKLRRLWFHLQDINPASEFIDMHLYVSKGNNPILFPSHHDRPNNLIIQGQGSTEWIMYDEYGTCDHPFQIKDHKMKVLYKRKMKHGDYLFIPSRQYHRTIAKKGRLSISVMYR